MIVKRAGYMLAILAALLAFPQMVLAQSFDAGKRAYERRDYAGALEQWRPLARNGHAEAQSFLGQLYGEGAGVRKDYVESARWFRLASEQGDADAQFALGNYYMDGTGVPQDNVLAYKWLLLSAAQGDLLAEGILDLVRDDMTRGQIRKGEKLAREWAAKRK